MLSVRELIGDLDVALLAGEAQLDAPVRWVHISELPDPTPWLSGGELLLTTGMALENDDDLERFLLSRNPRFLRLLARSERSGRVPLAEADRLIALGPAKGRRDLPTRGSRGKRSR